MQHVIRPARPDDAMAVAAVHVSSWQWAYRHVLAASFLERLSVGERAEGWQRWLAAGDPLAHLIVAEADGVVVGFVAVGEARPASQHPGVGEIYALYLVEERSGRGIGRRLLRAGEEHLRRSGCSGALLWVLEANHRARRFYEAAGWQRDGSIKLEAIGGVDVGELRYRRRL